MKTLQTVGLVGGAVVIGAGGLVIGRYVVPASSQGEANTTLPTTPQPGSTTSPTSTTTVPVTTAASPQADLPNGIYVDGGSGTPHYFVELTTGANGLVNGALSYVYQDGQTSAVFSFNGTPGSGAGNLTTSSGDPAQVSFTYDLKTFQLGECGRYLTKATSNADCTFNYSPSGIQ